MRCNRNTLLLPGRIGFASLFFLCLFPTLALSQSIGDFQSRQSGNWSRSNTWEEYTASGWQNTGNFPTTNAGVVTIKTGDDVTGNKRGSYDQIIVESGATLDIRQTFKIVDGPGVDLDVYGTFEVNKTTRLQGTGSAIFRNGSTTAIDGGDRLRFEDSSIVTFEGGSIVTTNGIFQPEDNAQVNIEAGSYFTNTGRILLRNSANLDVTNSTILNQGDFDVTQTSTVNFGTGGIYIHDQNGDAAS